MNNSYFKVYFLNFLERFITIGLKSFVVLYFIQFLDVENEVAAMTLSIFFFWEYFFSICTGKLIDSLGSDRKALWIGYVCILLGSMLLTNKSFPFVYLALSFFVLGAALIKPAIAHLLKRTLQQFKKSSYGNAYIIMHMTTNIAAIFAPLVFGYLLKENAIELLQVVLLLVAGLGVVFISKMIDRKELSIQKDIIFLGLNLLIVGIIYLSFLFQTLFLYISLPIVFLIGERIVRSYKKSSYIDQTNFRSMFLILSFFFMYFLINIQKLSTLTLIIQRFVDRSLYGFEIPTLWFLSSIALFVILFSFLKSRYGKKESTIKTLLFGVKIEILLYFLFSVFLLYSNNLTWIVILLFYAGFAYSEICISPIVIAYIAEKSPQRTSSNFYFGLAPATAALASYLNIFLSKYFFFEGSSLVRNFSVFLLFSAFCLMFYFIWVRKKISEAD